MRFVWLILAVLFVFGCDDSDCKGELENCKLQTIANSNCAGELEQCKRDAGTEGRVGDQMLTVLQTLTQCKSQFDKDMASFDANAPAERRFSVMALAVDRRNSCESVALNVLGK